MHIFFQKRVAPAVQPNLGVKHGNRARAAVKWIQLMEDNVNGLTH